MGVITELGGFSPRLQIAWHADCWLADRAAFTAWLPLGPVRASHDTGCIQVAVCSSLQLVCVDVGVAPA